LKGEKKLTSLLLLSHNSYIDTPQISFAIKYINSLSQFDNEEEEEEHSEPTVSQASEDAEEDDPSGTFYNSPSAEASLRRRTFAAAAGGGDVRDSHETVGGSGSVDDSDKKES